MERFTLKNVKFSERMSEETNCYTADLYFDGKPLAYCRNYGHGGETNVMSLNPKDSKRFEEAEAYCFSLPPFKVSEDYNIPMSLDLVSDLLLEKWIEAKNEAKVQRRMNKDMKTNILYQNPNQIDSYYRTSFTSNGKDVLIEDLLKSPIGRIKLIDYCNTRKKQGFVILNTNLPFEV